MKVASGKVYEERAGCSPTCGQRAELGHTSLSDTGHAGGIEQATVQHSWHI